MAKQQLNVEIDPEVLKRFRLNCHVRSKKIGTIVQGLIDLWNVSPDHLNDAARAAVVSGRAVYSGAPASLDEVQQMDEQPGVSLQELREVTVAIAAHQEGLIIDRQLGQDHTCAAAFDASQARSGERYADMRVSARTAQLPTTEPAPSCGEPDLLEPPDGSVDGIF